MKENSNATTEEKVYPILTSSVLQALSSLQEPNGTLSMYETFITRMERILLSQGDDIGLDDSTTLSYIRILHMLRADLLLLGLPREEKEGEIPEPDNL